MDQRWLELSDNSGVIVLSRNASAENISFKKPKLSKNCTKSKFYNSGMFTSELQALTEISLSLSSEIPGGV